MGRDQADLSSFEYLKEQSFHNTSYNLFHPHGKINLPSTQLDFPMLQLLPCSGAPATRLAPSAPKVPLSPPEKLKITRITFLLLFLPTWFPSPLLVCHMLLPPVPCHRACKRVMSPPGSALCSGRKGDLERRHPTPRETGFPQIVIQLPVTEGIQKNVENTQYTSLTGSVQSFYAF